MSPEQKEIENNCMKQLLTAIRRNGHSYQTFLSYKQALRAYFRWLCDTPAGRKFKKTDDPKLKCEAYLSAYADTRISASTQNSAHAALRYWYVEVMKIDPGLINAKRAKVGERVRTAPSVEETVAVLNAVKDTEDYPCQLIALVMYALGLRLNETLSIRLKDINWEMQTLVIQQGKGKKDRYINIPPVLIEPLLFQARDSYRVHRKILKRGIPLALPDKLDVKSPKLRFSWKWMWLFPLATPSVHPFTGETVWWHCLDGTIQKALSAACDAVNLPGWITPHKLRHAWATHASQDGADIRDLAEILGHGDIRVTMRYITPDKDKVPSPLQRVASKIPNLIHLKKSA
jgi:site-specific recombinase XerD